MAKILIGTDLDQIVEFPTHKMTAEEQKDWCYRNQVRIKELGTKALTRLESWSKQAELIERKYRIEDDILLKRVIVSDWLTSEIQDLTTSYKHGQQAMDELQRNLDQLVAQSAQTQDHIQVVMQKVEAATERLETNMQDLQAAHKRHDRASSKLVAALTYGGLGDMAEPSDMETEKEPKKEEVEKETTDDVSESQLEENKQILLGRDKEFDHLKRDRQLLLREEERLLSMFTMGEDRLVETEYVKTLKLSIEHYRDRFYHLEQRRADIERKMDQATASRRQLIDQSKSEKVAQSMTMETELRRLEGDLNRIRGQRDHFQLLVEEQKAKDARDKEAQDKIVASANEGKTRIAALEARILELKASSEPVVTEAFEAVQAKLKHARVVLASLETIEKRSVSSNVFSNEAMKQLLTQFKADPAIVAYDQVKTEADIVAMMNDFLEKNESHLLQEIDRVAGIYGKLEEQQNKHVFDLAQKRDQAVKLQTEKSKYAQTFGSLISAKEKQLAVVTGLRTTNEKQQELVKQLEEKERSLEYQVVI
jgi:DNA repair exonuclease SbcCD ATPase subunit